MNDINDTQSNKSLLIFLLISLFVLLTVQQLEVIERGSMKYLLIVIPSLILPFTKIQYIITNVFIKTWPIFLMVLITLFWGIYKHDIQAVYRLVLYLLVLSWLEVSSLTLKVKTLSNIYIMCVVFAIIICFFSDVNEWGLLPGTTNPGNGAWRVSFFPNIANTGFISLFMFMLCTKDKNTFMNNKFIVFLSLYFVVFSFVRSAIISLLVYLMLKVLFNNLKNIKLLFLISVLVAIGLNIVIGYSVEIIHSLQSLPLVDRFLLRGEHALSNHDIYVQMYRPWVWKNQWNIFINSPYLMGEGFYNFNDFIPASLREQGVSESDAVSLLLGMLASYGLPAFLFYYYLLSKNYNNAVNLDAWACSIFPIIIFICMQWGCIFHPSCATFIIFFLVLVRGENAFV